ncbi:hypothetical protein DFJ73DRAFT_479292 [Zopfochytrium polystomum]|nr:hypothetical protein DFJ73DRAFT_479292 [Zopfochytrium polystomum]
MLCNWLVAFFCFEYKWASRGWTLERRIEHFESRWAYFAGLPCTALAFAFPIFLSAGFFAMLFPVYIIMANRASPSPKPSEAVRYTLWPERMAIFSIPSRVNNAILSALCGPRRARRQ